MNGRLSRYKGKYVEVIVNFRENEFEFLTNLSKEKDMANEDILRQAFRVYQTLHALDLMDEVSKLITNKTLGPGGCCGD